MAELSIFRVEYDWYEGDHHETLLAKEASQEEFERDLVDARRFAQSLMGKVVEGEYLGKGYSVRCLPEYYEQIIWFLINKREYIQSFFRSYIVYIVGEWDGDSVTVSRNEKTTISTELKEEKQ